MSDFCLCVVALAIIKHFRQMYLRKDGESLLSSMNFDAGKKWLYVVF
jgi:hypothetical protein